MDWSNRTVNNALTVERYTVNDIIVNYVQDLFYVNRRYQRKLVWGLKEKQDLIDSILKGIPLPAILLVKYDIPGEKENILEIVDGMQRLNAIVSFILGEFGVPCNNEICYFDPNANNETFQLLMNEDDRLKKNKSLLPKEVCLDFCRYQLPAIITGKDNATVDLIFSRINSTGRKISSHDLRQSMATGEFPDLVRRVASNVRMDNTYTDHICLCDVPKISIGNKKYGYGVDIDTVFWRRHDLIDRQSIKESKDEELIETILAMLLLDKFNKTKEKLDKLYEKGTPLNTKVETKLAEIGKDILEQRCKQVFDTIDMIFDAVSSDFSSYLFEERKTSNKDECFKVLFLAIYRLIAEGYVILNYANVAKCIKNAKSIFHEITSNGKITPKVLQMDVENLYKILKPSFSKEISAIIDNEMTKEIDKRLSYSKLERQMTEFKIGVSTFSSNTFNMNVIQDIMHTLVAMANSTSAKEEGLVILGVANNKQSFDDWQNVYKESAIIVNQHYVPGITAEAVKLCGDTDNYYRRLRKIINSEPVSPKLKNYILENFEPFNYHGVEVIIFKSRHMGEVSTYANIKYVRHSNETIKVK